jgi:hypothetical protein
MSLTTDRPVFDRSHYRLASSARRLGAICVSLLFIGASVVVVIFFVKMVRDWLLYRREKAARGPTTVSAGSDGQLRDSRDPGTAATPGLAGPVTG